MEFFEIYNQLKKNLRIIVLSTLAFSLLGAALFYMLPKQYVATGLLYVQRRTESNKENVFTYEGFYGQQTAQTHTNTVIGYLESTNLHKRVLDNFQIPVTEKNLTNLSRKIKITKNAPQLINLTIKTPSEQESRDIWNFITDETVRTAQSLNSEGDPNLTVSPVSEPILKEQYRRLWINLLLGAGLGFLSASVLSVLSAYFKEGEQ
jgi:capsular polysaccharide biosynthesis protein